MIYDFFIDASKAAKHLSLENKDQRVYLNYDLGWKVTFYPEEPLSDYWWNGEYTLWENEP